MSEWISVNDRLPLDICEEAVFESLEVIVTDGVRVTNGYFDRGNGAGKPWAQWGADNEIDGSKVTHWMSLPLPPK